MLSHKEKVHLARKLQTRTERKNYYIGIPKLPHGTMISRLFTSKNWVDRRDAIAGRNLDEPKVQVASEVKVEEGQGVDKGSSGE